MKNQKNNFEFLLTVHFFSFFSSFLMLMKSYLPNRYRFAKNPNEKEPRDPELDVL
jgi:hypothetical protein